MTPANYFDGRSTRVHPVQLSVSADRLVLDGGEIQLQIPLALVDVDERLGSAPRRLRFPDGAFCEVSDLAALDRLLSATGYRDGWVDRMQRHGGWILAMLFLSVVVTAAAYRWGLPWAAEIGARRLSPAIATKISTSAMETLDRGWLLKSGIPEARQQSLSMQFDALQGADPGSPRSALLFRASPRLGANAFTLPDGTVVLLDELIASLDDDQRIMAVLAHELGHAHEKHGMQLLLRSTVVGAFLTFYLGDISQLLAAAPAALVQARYSQDFERQADDFGARLLQDHGLSADLLADALSDLSKIKPVASKGGYLSSHPSTDERIRRLRSLGEGRPFPGRSAAPQG